MRQDEKLLMRLPCANKKIRKMYFSMMKTTFETLDDTINNLQILKVRTKVKFPPDINDYHDQLNYMFEEDLFGNTAQGIAMIMQEALLLLNF